LQETARFVSCGRLETKIRLITPRSIGDVKNRLAYGLESVIIIGAKINPQLAIFQISPQELVILSVPVESPEA
jgi:hypothetical protein